MAKWMRLAAVGVSLLVTGMAFTAAGFTLFEAAHSDAAIRALTLVLFAGNFGVAADTVAGIRMAAINNAVRARGMWDSLFGIRRPVLVV